MLESKPTSLACPGICAGALYLGVWRRRYVGGIGGGDPQSVFSFKLSPSASASLVQGMSMLMVMVRVRACGVYVVMNTSQCWSTATSDQIGAREGGAMTSIPRSYHFRMGATDRQLPMKKLTLEWVGSNQDTGGWL